MDSWIHVVKVHPDRLNVRKLAKKMNFVGIGLFFLCKGGASQRPGLDLHRVVSSLTRTIYYILVAFNLGVTSLSIRVLIT